MSSVVAPVQVQFRTEGVEAVKRATDEVAASVARSTRQAATGGAETSAVIGRIGASARTAAGGLEAMARTGNASGEAMKVIAASGAEMAFMFGPQGAIAGAVAITGIAIFQFFKRTRDEIEATRKKAQEETDRLLNAGDYRGLQEKLRTLEQGTPAGGFEDGISGKEAKIAALEAMKQRAEETWNLPRALSLKEKIAKAKADLQPLLDERARLTNLILYPPTAPRPITGLPAVVSTAAAPGAKPKAGKDPKSLLDLYPGAPSASSIAAAVVDKYTGGSLARGADKVTRDSLSDMAGQTAASVTESVRAAIAAGKSAVGEGIQSYKSEIETRTKAIAEFVQGGVANTLSSAISSAMQAAFNGEGVGGAINGFLKAMLIGIGQMFQQLGQTYLAGAKLLAGIQLWIKANPELAIPASLALIALGAALQAGGSAMGGGGGGYGVGGSGYSAAAAGNVIDRGYINPANPLLGANRISPAQPVTVNATVIGANDPAAQRGVVELLQNAAARGHRV